MMSIHEKIRALDQVTLVRLAREVYSSELVAPSDEFERQPPTLSSLVQSLAHARNYPDKLADSDVTLARRLLLFHARDPSGARELEALIDRVDVETMGPELGTTLLVALFLYVLRDHISVTIANDGPEGDLRWQVQIGRGVDEQRANIITDTALSVLGAGSEDEAVDKPVVRGKSALYQLFLSLFENDDLRRFLRFDLEAVELVNELPGPKASASDLACEAVLLLSRHGLVNEALFECLRAARPRRTQEIARVEAVWQNMPARKRRFKNSSG